MDLISMFKWSVYCCAIVLGGIGAQQLWEAVQKKKARKADLEWRANRWKLEPEGKPASLTILGAQVNLETDLGNAAEFKAWDFVGAVSLAVQAAILREIHIQRGALLIECHPGPDRMPAASWLFVVHGSSITIQYTSIAWGMSYSVTFRPAEQPMVSFTEMNKTIRYSKVRVIPVMHEGQS